MQESLNGLCSTLQQSIFQAENVSIEESYCKDIILTTTTWTCLSDTLTQGIVVLLGIVLFQAAVHVPYR